MAARRSWMLLPHRPGVMQPHTDCVSGHTGVCYLMPGHSRVREGSECHWPHQSIAGTNLRVTVYSSPQKGKDCHKNSPSQTGAPQMWFYTRFLHPSNIQVQHDLTDHWHPHYRLLTRVKLRKATIVLQHSCCFFIDPDDAGVSLAIVTYL